MARKAFCAATLLLLSAFSLTARQNSDVLSADSVPARKKPAKWTLTNQFHTGSMFYFTGVVSGSKPSFDMRLVYDKNGWGALLFKSFELIEHNAGINYALVVLNKRLYFGKRWLISPQVGTQLNQIGSIAGPGTDFLTNLTIAYKITPEVTISNDAVMQNLVLTHRANWTNRVKLGYQKAGLVASVSVWDRNRVFNNPGYLSGGMELGYSGIHLSPTMNLFVGATSISVFQADTPRKSGFRLSCGVSM